MAKFMLILLVVVGMYFLVCLKTGEQQFTFLARSFLQGKTYFLEFPGKADLVFLNGHFYWPLGPFPAIFLAPLVLVIRQNNFQFQGLLQWLWILGSVFLAYYLARIKGFSKSNSYFLTLALLFGSVCMLLIWISWSWYLVQAACMFFSLLALVENEKRRRYWLIGLLAGIVFLNRFTAGVIGLFFLLQILASRDKLMRKFLNSLQLCLPIVLSGLILLGYNYIRFGNVVTNGYMQTNNYYLSESARYELLKYGLFNIHNVPTNLYYYFIKTFEPVRENVTSAFGRTYMLTSPYMNITNPGVNFFIVSPAFIYLLRTRFKDWRERITILAPTLIILGLLMCYYWTGWRQVGPRYMIDVMPLFYLMLLKSFPGFKLSNNFKIVVFLSVWINFYLHALVFWE